MLSYPSQKTLDKKQDTLKAVSNMQFEISQMDQLQVYANMLEYQLLLILIVMLLMGEIFLTLSMIP